MGLAVLAACIGNVSIPYGVALALFILVADWLYAVLGMSALAVAIIGGPMIMTFLVLESTSNFSVTMTVLVASVASAITMRRLFGYSLSTWRFHLRGEAIRSAVDISWIEALTVDRMMRRGQHTVDGGMPISAFRTEFPLGVTPRAIVTTSERIDAGVAYPAEAHALHDTSEPMTGILHHSLNFLLPQMIIKEAVAALQAAKADALAVLDGLATRQVLGLLMEQYALGRYSEELDRRRR